MDETIENRRQVRWCIAFAFVLFAFSVWLGYELAILYPESTKNLVKQSLSQFDFVKNLNVFFTFLFIFFNNLIKGFLAMVLGTLFGVIPVIFIFTNGELLGLVIGIFSLTADFKSAIAGLAPHGIFEIPAIIISTGYGIWLGYRFYRLILFREPFKRYFFYALRRFAEIVLPLLIIAAFVETFVTPVIIEIF